MRSGRATIGEPRKNDDLERTRDRKRRSSSSANADPGPIGDRTRTEELGLVTSRRVLSRLSDRYAGTRTRTVAAAAAGQTETIAVPPDGAVSAARARQTIGHALLGGFRAWSIAFDLPRARLDAIVPRSAHIISSVSRRSFISSVSRRSFDLSLMK